jgi:hypothetical protein
VHCAEFHSAEFFLVQSDRLKNPPGLLKSKVSSLGLMVLSLDEDSHASMGHNGCALIDFPFRHVSRFNEENKRYAARFVLQKDRSCLRKKKVS